MGARDPSEDSPNDRVTPSEPTEEPIEDDEPVPTDEPIADDEPVADDAAGVDVVWFPGDDDHVVVAAGDGERAVRFHQLGEYGVAGVAALLAGMGVVVVHGAVTANTALAWPVSGVVFASAAIVLGAYAWRRYDPGSSPTVVAHDVPVADAIDEFDLEE